ncbi:DEAD/DEAH box helicase [Croceimicrobium hydrocarbonivorans]|uniref:DEAD/DEAH box helicase n=1 Tax=Croceimicrobium hydrocarbonivorans TaxID=2761580 RepID=A0A7H0VEG7_9FLAO|nr:DEAD/DEAH box helicase [Croceimicrobium hydrocarbonivorans]QNR24115.1 DEAD/DEAH box helicase [Croceimicrobium hydrocarbonivorans]
MKFSDFNLNPDLLESLSYMNFEEATPIQEQAIPLILEGKDIIGCAQTGTGKTAAFVLPVLHKLVDQRKKGVIDSLILCPTRELAIQIEQQIQGLAYFSDLTSYAVYGGGTGPEWEAERRALSEGTDIIIATPGRLLAHIRNEYVKLDQLQYLILDEADRMLDIGFYDDIKRIIQECPPQRQSLMFSATMAPKIRKLAKEILQDPAEVNLAVSKPAEGVTQMVYMAHEEQKQGLARHIIAQYPDFKSIIIFCSTKKKIQKLVASLQRKGLNVEGISSDYEQSEREKILLQFKARKTRILVATDVLSRGIDIKDIDLVINYDVPNDAEDYVHRVGRTARAAAKGMAITFISGEEIYKFKRIETFVERDYEKLSPPEDLGKAPEWKEPERRSRNSRGRSQGNRPPQKGGNKSRKPQHKKAGNGPKAEDGSRPDNASKPKRRFNKRRPKPNSDSNSKPKTDS